VKQTSEVISNNGLATSRRAGSLNQAPATAATGATAATKKKKTKKDEDKWAEWKKRFADARQVIEDAEADLQALSSQALARRLGLNNAGDGREQNRRAQTDVALRERSQAEKALADAKKALQDLREEARRAGVPAAIRR
jgi:hypothetical protein